MSDKKFEKFVEYAIICENPNISDEKLKAKMSETLYDASKIEDSKRIETQSMWASVSQRFAAETKSDVYVLCGNAPPKRIFEMDEFVTLCEKAPNGITINDISISDILALPESERFTAIQSVARTSFEKTEVYFDEDGEIVGKSIDNTFLENYAKDYTIPECSFSVSFTHHINYVYSDNLKNAFGLDDVSFKNMQKNQGLNIVKLQEFEYCARTYAKTGDKELRSHLMQNTDQVLSIIGKEQVTLGDLTFSRGNNITRSMEDGTKKKIAVNGKVARESGPVNQIRKRFEGVPMSGKSDNPPRHRKIDRP